MGRRLSLLIVVLVVGWGSGCGIRPPGTLSASLDSAPALSPNPQWQPYGAYVQRMVDAIEKRWNKNIMESRTYPKSGTSVSVSFYINAKGEVARIGAVEETAGRDAVRACVSAIADGAPYGVWTSEMKAALGTEDKLTFTFYYQ